MKLTSMDFSARGRGRVLVVTLSGTLFCVAVTVMVDSFSFAHLSASERLHSILIDIFLPIALAAPMIGLLMSKLRELSIAKHELTILASTDSLTAVLNRGAFTMIVDGYLDRVQSTQLAGPGALLIVDVDHFKQVNDIFGHDRGDVALKLIAKSIQDSVRDVDLVGRIGGEEFGVFLPGSSVADANQVAERIRASIDEADFRPEGARQHLSVSIGGATFLQYVPFDELFHTADQRLYAAKAAGRNRVEMGALTAA
jgi:diguanylate cyclase